MVAPAAKRTAVGAMQDEFRMSQRRAAELVDLGRASCRYQTRRSPEAHLEKERLGVARDHPRWGYRMLTDLLRGAAFEESVATYRGLGHVF